MGIIEIFTWLMTLNFLLTLTSASVLQFSLGDLSVEMQTYGTILLARFNNSIENDLVYSRLKLKITNITLLDSQGKIVAAHKFEVNRLQEYAIDTWQGAKYGSLGASGRRMSSVSLGDLSGRLDLQLYVFTESGKLPTISEDYHHNVTAQDALVLMELHNLTQCLDCSRVKFVEVRVQVTEQSAFPVEVTSSKLDDIQLDTIHILASSIITVSNKVTLDKDHTEVVPGYPKVDKYPDHVDLITRFPSFSSSASYGLFIQQDRRTPEQVVEDMKQDQLANSNNSTNDALSSSDKARSSALSCLSLTLICLYTVIMH